MIEFEGVLPALGQALHAHGYTELTPVQKAVLTSRIGQADALVSAQTGSGKTVAFGLAMAPTLLGDASHFAPPSAPLALVVAPTRELALQINRELTWLYEFTGAVFASCVGGMDMGRERNALARGAHIIVGTPGRLRDHIQRTSLDTSKLAAVVLDEADEMLDLGFRDDLEFILEATPVDRRTLLFSATVPRPITTLARKYQRDAVRIKTSGEEKQHLDISYRALEVSPSDRENAIINVLRYYEPKNALVFANTRAAVNHMTARLNNRGFSVVALSGELSQNERTHALQSMRDGRAQVCVATDVAARGIDLPDLELVIHADLPTDPDTLLHRSGRTGRAGRKGVSALIVPRNMVGRAKRLLGTARIDAVWALPPSASEILIRDNERLLADPTLIEPVQPEEQDIIQTLLARHGADQIAAAFLRSYRAGRSSLEELMPVTERYERPRPDFAPRVPFDASASAWFTISVGRKHNAEPRWLIPMLCKAADITKSDIGSIRIQHEVTHVELNAAGADRLMQAIGPSRKLENSITANRLDEPPADAGIPPRQHNTGKDRHKSKSSNRGKPTSSPAARSHPKSSAAPNGQASDPAGKGPAMPEAHRSGKSGRNKNFGKPKGHQPWRKHSSKKSG